MNNFISLLDTTLKLNKDNDKSDDDDRDGGDDDDDREGTLTPANLMPCNNRTYVVAKRPVNEVDEIGGGDVMSEGECQEAPVVTFAPTPVNIIDPNVPLPARTSKNLRHFVFEYMSFSHFFMTCDLCRICH